MNAKLIVWEGYRRNSLIGFCKIFIFYMIFIAGVCAHENNQKYDFNIKEDTLAAVLDAIVKQSGALVLYPPALANEKGMEPAIGRYTINEVLKTILSKSDFSGSLTESGVIVISQNNSDKVKQVESNMIAKKNLLATMIGFFVGAGGVPHANAQDAASSSDKQSNPVVLEEISVTASRVTSRAGYEAPTPTTVIDIEGLQDSSQVNIANTINQMPSMGRAVSPRTTGSQVGSASQGANFLNLRGLGTNRTLVLLDGRRFVASQATGQVDMNMLPTGLAKRVDIVSGGASAAWGSDAVAGVVNVVLDKEYTGTKVSVQTGVSGESDAEELKVSIANGFDFSDGRGHFIGSFTYTDAGEADKIGERDWFRSTKAVTDGPITRVLDNVGLNDAYHGGIIVTGPNTGQYFNPDGSLGTWDYGNQYGSFSQGGSAIDLDNDQASYMDVTAFYEQTTAFGRIDFDITENINVYAEANYGYTEANSGSSTYRLAGARGGLTIQDDNAYLAELGLPPQGFVLGHTNMQIGGATPHNDRTVERFVLGTDFNLPGGWSGAAYYQHGDSEIVNSVLNDPVKSRYALAADAVYDSGGNIVCRSTRDIDPSNGCVPLNVFGEGNMSSEAIKYVVGVPKSTIDLTQDAFSLSFSGDLFELPAGPMSAAFGVDYRDESFQATADDLSLLDDYWVGNYKPTPKASYDVTEFFAEVIIPVFKDSSLGEALDFNAAVRSTDYSTSGRVTTWKTGATYDIGSGLRLRGAISRDIRAPNLSELFLGGSSATQTATNRVTGRRETFLRASSGNDQLVPEESDTNTIGIIYQPEFIEGLNISLDYVEIDITDSITNLSNQDVIDGCQLDGDPMLCDRLSFNSRGSITGLVNQPLNLSQEYLASYNLEVGYRFDAFGGQMSLNSQVSYLTDHYTIGYDSNATDNEPAPKNNVLGELSSSPLRIKALNTIAYRNDSWKLSLRHRYDHSGVLDNEREEGVDIIGNNIPSMNYFDLTATKNLTINDMDVEVFGTIENMFDKNPTRIVSLGRASATETGVSNSQDLIGRYFRLGIRLEM
jgi:outer membrane receptor protein involved in Fe transport